MTRMEIVIAWCACLLGVFLIGLFLLGCGAGPQRITTETYWPGDPPAVAVEWPDGVIASEVNVFEIHGRTIVVGPAESVY